MKIKHIRAFVYTNQPIVVFCLIWAYNSLSIYKKCIKKHKETAIKEYDK